MKEKDRLEKCLQDIETLVGWGPASEWSSGRFQELSDLIELRTGLLVNAKTLWRILKKERSNLDYEPQRATKDALARLLGYDSWIDLIDQQQRSLVNTIENRTNDLGTNVAEQTLADFQPSVYPEKSSNRSRSLTVILWSVFTVVIIIGLVLWQYGKHSGANVYNTETVLTLDKTTGPVPLTINIKIRKSSNEADSLYLDFGSKPTPELIPNKDQIIAKTYQAPFYGFCKVKTRTGFVIDSVPLHLTSPNWTKAILSEKHYFELGTIEDSSNNQFAISQHELDLLGPALNKTQFYSKFLLSQQFGYSLSNKTISFDYEPDAKPSYKKCAQLAVQFTLEKGRFLFLHAPKGCEETQRIVLPNRNYTGKKTDLSSYALAPTAKQHLEYQFTEDSILIRIDNRKCPSFALTKSQIEPELKMISLKTGFLGTISNFKIE